MIEEEEEAIWGEGQGIGLCVRVGVNELLFREEGVKENVFRGVNVLL